MTAKQLRIVAIARETLGDTENVESALSVRCAAAGVTAATLTVGVGYYGTYILSTSVTGGTISDLSIELEDVSTIRSLVDLINAEDGYTAELLGEDGSRSPEDIIPVSAISILQQEQTLSTQHWFSSLQILRWADEFCERRMGGYTTENVPDDDEVYVALNAALHGCNMLLANAAKYYSFSIEGFSGNRGALVSQYQMLYNNIKDRIDTLGHNITISRIVRPGRNTGGLVPTSQVVNATPVKLISADISGSDVTLTWGQSLSVNFYCYEVWQDSGSGYVLVTSLTNRHTRSYTIESLSAGSYSFKIRVVISMSVPILSYPTTVPSDSRKYADSNVVTAEVS